jgi:hypothetical protein
MSGPATNSDNLFRLSSFRPSGVAFKINQLHQSHTRFANVLACFVQCKSLGCYMVKPHGQLVLVS